MKLVAIIMVFFGAFYCVYIRGYSIGYDDAKEAYTELYEKIREIEKESYELRLELLEP